MQRKDGTPIPPPGWEALWLLLPPVMCAALDDLCQELANECGEPVNRAEGIGGLIAAARPEYFGLPAHGRADESSEGGDS